MTTKYVMGLLSFIWGTLTQMISAAIIYIYVASRVFPEGTPSSLDLAIVLCALSTFIKYVGGKMMDDAAKKKAALQQQTP